MKLILLSIALCKLLLDGTSAYAIQPTEAEGKVAAACPGCQIPPDPPDDCN